MPKSNKKRKNGKVKKGKSNVTSPAGYAVNSNADVERNNRLAIIEANIFGK
ncbi:hypothetical protein NVP1029O_18 [Vibrio phage 1.029.O._10N.261.55.A7]|nr:hypothetical protein NVP1029O_18 [Vibrio phage 1.029.O._10N.261.55.A7]